MRQDDVIDLVHALVAEAKHTGLSWIRKIATVVRGDNPRSVSVVYDGDATGTVVAPVYSLLGSLPTGTRVYVDAVPPSGAYIAGLVGYKTATDVQVFDVAASGTDWVKPSGAYMCRIRVQGSGGAGGGAVATGVNGVSAGSGGGAGGYAESILPASSVTDTVTVTVGAAGAAVSGAAGGAGNTSSFGAYVAASGGSGGTIQTTTSALLSQGAPTSGGAGTAGLILSAGGAGDCGIVWGSATNPNSRSGNGGVAMLGGGAPGRQANSAGVAAGTYGGGGSGAANSVSQVARAGGNGGAGVVIIETWFS